MSGIGAPTYAVCVQIEEKACEGRRLDLPGVVDTLKDVHPFFVGVVDRDLAGGRDAQLSEQIFLNV